MSDYAYDIVNAIYNGDKIDAMELISNAMASKSVEAIATKRVEVAQNWFSTNQTEEEEEE